MNINRLTAVSEDLFTILGAGIGALYVSDMIKKDEKYPYIQDRKVSAIRQQNSFWKARRLMIDISLVDDYSRDYGTIREHLASISKNTDVDFSRRITVYREGTSSDPMRNFVGPWSVMPSTKKEPEITAQAEVYGPHTRDELKAMESLGEVQSFESITSLLSDGDEWVAGITFDPTTITKEFDTLDDDQLYDFFLATQEFEIPHKKYASKPIMTIAKHFKVGKSLYCATYHHTKP